jgi:hypothetical protein
MAYMTSLEIIENVRGGLKTMNEQASREISEKGHTEAEYIWMSTLIEVDNAVDTIFRGGQPAKS